MTAALVKLVYVLAHTSWEFVMYLDYEFSILRGRRKFSWTSLFYVGCRWCTLAALIVQLVGFGNFHGINCQVRSLSFLYFEKEWKTVLRWCDPLI